MELEIGWNCRGEINDDFTEIVVYYDSEGWDSRERWRQDMEAASENAHDGINEPVWEALQKIGYDLSEETHEFDEDDELIVYKIVKA
jgi:hypothetical protein